MSSFCAAAINLGNKHQSPEDGKTMEDEAEKQALNQEMAVSNSFASQLESQL